MVASTTIIQILSTALKTLNFPLFKNYTQSISTKKTTEIGPPQKKDHLIHGIKIFHIDYTLQSKYST